MYLWDGELQGAKERIAEFCGLPTLRSVEKQSRERKQKRCVVRKHNANGERCDADPVPSPRRSGRCNDYPEREYDGD